VLALLRIAHSLEYAAWALGEINRKLDAKPRKRGHDLELGRCELGCAD
jgi:hypothetical protein